MHLDLITIVFFVIAVLIFIRLWGVLGEKTGAERPPALPRDDRDDGSAGNDNVIPISRGTDQPRRDVPPPPPTETQQPVDAGPETPLTAALRTIVAADRGFDPKHFVDGAKMAYEMIVTAYAKGDRRTLKNLLAKDVMDSFGRGLDEREGRGEKVEFTFVGIDRAEIVEATVAEGVARITVRFAAKVISATRNTAGEIVDGDLAKLADRADVWTFAREVSANDPNWRLAETRALA